MSIGTYDLGSNDKLYVVNDNDCTVLRGKNNTVIGNPLGLGAFDITFDPANRDLYVYNSNPTSSNPVSVISTLPSALR